MEISVRQAESEAAMAAAAAAWQMSSWMAPHLTPVLQITDTNMAAVFKAALQKRKDNIHGHA